MPTGLTAPPAVAPVPRVGVRAALAVRVGSLAATLSRRLRLGEGAIIGGRVALALCPDVLTRLSTGCRVVLVSGTNGKTTTSHLLAAALRTAGPVAHNASGANMADGAVAALMSAPDAPVAVLEVDELHLARVATAVQPTAILLLNVTRDQLDRGTEVRAVAGALQSALASARGATVVANADDPMAVWAADGAAPTVWVRAGAAWLGDARSCPRCGRTLKREPATAAVDAFAQHRSEPWACRCGLTRSDSAWARDAGGAVTPFGPVPVTLALPGRFNDANAVMAMAAAAQLGVPPQQAAPAMAAVHTVAGRYATVQHGDRELRLLLAKNPAGFVEAIDVLEPARSLLVAINAREADGRDTSWLWDVPFERLAPRPVVASGERAADLGVRLSYADVDHRTENDLITGLERLPPGKVDVVANYTAFIQLRRRLPGQEQP